MQFSKQDHEAISAAIHEAEQRTSGQIVCVLAHSSSAYAYVPILWASALALFAPWPLIDFTPWSVQRIFLIQLAVFIIAGVAFSLTPLRRLLVPRAVQRARAHRAALEQFVVRRVAHTKNRTGVLIFVSVSYTHLLPVLRFLAAAVRRAGAPFIKILETAAELRCRIKWPTLRLGIRRSDVGYPIHRFIVVSAGLL